MSRMLTCRTLVAPVVWSIVMIGIPVTGVAESGKSSPTRVTIDQDGFVRVNGKRRYIYGAFRDPSDSITEFTGLKQARFDLTHEYLFEVQINGDTDKWIRRARTYLRGAAEQRVDHS